MEDNVIEVDKIGSATSPLGLSRTVNVIDVNGAPRAGDVVVVRVLTDTQPTTCWNSDGSAGEGQSG